MGRIVNGFSFAGSSSRDPIAALFASGEEGAWYDPSDLSTMFTTSAGSTLASVDGPVGRIEDKSGNANHATQATAAARPTLRQTAGGLYYLEFDGVDDQLLFAVGLTGNTALTNHVAAAKKGTQTGRRAFLVLGAGGIRQGVDSGYGATADKYNFSIGGVADLTGSVANFPGTVLQTATKNSARDYVYRENGAQQAAVTDTANLSLTDTAQLGARYAAISQGDIYGAVVRGALSTASEIAAAEAWLAAKSGVSL